MVLYGTATSVKLRFHIQMWSFWFPISDEMSKSLRKFMSFAFAFAHIRPWIDPLTAFMFVFEFAFNSIQFFYFNSLQGMFTIN